MNLFPSTAPQTQSQNNNEVLINVIVKQMPNGKTVAMVPGLPELDVEAINRVEALAQLQQNLEIRLADAEIVTLPIKLPRLQQENPWLEMAGVFKDDPQFEQMLEAIKNYRSELDKDIENDLEAE